eukprot:scaffold6.g2705.t1
MPRGTGWRCRTDPLQAAARPARPASDDAPEPAGDPSSPATEQQQQPYRFTYPGADGRQKATLHAAFMLGGGAAGGRAGVSAGGGRPAAPWGLGWQLSEKSLIWNDALKDRLVQLVAAQELGMREGELAALLERLAALLPALRPRLASMPPHALAALAVDELAGRLVALKEILPSADVGLLASRAPRLLLDPFDPAALATAAARLRALLPGVVVGALVEKHPEALDAEGLEAALAEAARIMPGLDLPAAMRSDPALVLRFQRGEHLIAGGTD